MVGIDVIAIEQEARQRRAEDMRRGEPVFLVRMGLYVRLLGETALGACGTLSGLLRPLFSWNPQAGRLRLS